MRNLTNRKLVLASRPVGIPGPEHFRLEEEEEAASPGDAELLVRNIYLSVDPAQRGWVNAVMWASRKRARRWRSRPAPAPSR